MTAAPDPAAALAPPSATGHGQGKVVLLGEHAVVFGHPALAAGLSLQASATARPGPGRVRIPAWDIDLALDDPAHAEHPVARALGELAATLGAPSFDLEVDTDLPPGAGLGSSAALATAAARALAALAGAPREGLADAHGDRLAAAVTAAERVFHASPSGLDAAIAGAGGFGLYSRADGLRPLRPRHALRLCIGLSGQRRRTADLVGSVARLCARTPSARRLVDALGDFAQAGAAALMRGDADELGRLFDLAHGALAGLGVSTAALDQLVHLARTGGALGAKLTGAGGGGAVIALAPEHESDVLARWRAAGFTGFACAIGQEVDA